MIRKFFGMAVALCTSLVVAPAAAQVGKDKQETKAAALRAEGEEFVKANDCKSALDPLRSAWALREDGKTAVLLGECELRLGHEPEAAYHLAHALELLPEGSERLRIDSIFRDLSARLARLDIVVNEAGAVVIVGDFVNDTPADALFVQPGDIEVTVKKTGFEEQQRKVHVVAGKTERLEFVLTRRTKGSEMDHAEKEARNASMIPTYVGAGAAIASIGVGIGLRFAGTNQGEQADALLDKLVGLAPCKADPAPEDCATILNLRLEHDRYVNASTGLFVTGGVLLAGTFVYAMVASRKTPRDVAILPVVSPTNNGLLIQGRF